MHLPSLLLDLLALVGGTVHVTAPDAEPLLATVLIEDGLIVAVGPDLELPEGVEVVDCSGLHLIPGLIDGLAYHDREHDLLYTNAGVTLVRDHGNDLGRIFGEAAPDVRDFLGGPTLSISGALLDGSPPSTGSALVLRDEHEVHQLLPTMVAEGVGFLAVGEGLSEEAWRTVLEQAHPAAGRQLQVWGPVPRGLDLQAVIAAGQDGLLFLDGLLPASGTWDDEVALAATIDEVAASGLALTPLLRGTARLLDDPGQDPIELLYLGPQYSRSWRGDLDQRTAQLKNDEYLASGEAVLASKRKVVAQLYAAGVPLVPGSGAPHPWLMPGHGLILELREWQRAGIPAADLLQLVTVRAAATLGLDKQRGALAPGLVGDVVALRADPREAVENLFQVELVVLRGTPLARVTLDSRLAELVETQALAKEEAALPIEVSMPELPEGAVLLTGRTESSVSGARIAEERWAIVRELDQSLTFVGHRVTPGTIGRESVSVHSSQRLRKGRFEAFEVRVTTGGQELKLRGLRVAGQWRIERRFNGKHVDTQAAREALAAVDMGSVTTLLLLAHSREPGDFPVLFLDEALELSVVGWAMDLDGEGGYGFKTPRGVTFTGFTELGAPKVIIEQRGNGAIRTTSLEISGLGGPGLPVPGAAPVSAKPAVPESDVPGEAAGEQPDEQ